jgi:hypothetical protein
VAIASVTFALSVFCAIEAGGLGEVVQALAELLLNKFERRKLLDPATRLKVLMLPGVRG